jgi:DNA polymerase-1
VSKVFKERSIPIEFFDKKTGTIKESVSKTVLADVTDSLVKLYLDYKATSKQSSTYGEAFLDHVNPATGRIHTSLFQIKDTGRTSSGTPNLQNIPNDKEYRAAFEAPEGYTFVVADYSQQEARLLAHLSQDPTFLQMFYDGLDYHLETAKKAFGDPTLTKESPERKLAKNTGFAIAFGGGAATIHQRYKVRLDRAKDLVKRYFEVYPRLKAYFEEQGDLARERGYILIDNIVKRRSYLPKWDIFKFCERHLHLDVPTYHSTYKTLRAEYQRKAQNYRPQGNGASISKLAGVLLRKYSSKFEIILLVHDEWILLCKEEDAPYVKDILERCMVEAASVYSDLVIPAESVVTKIWNK